VLGEEDGFDLGKQLAELLPDIKIVYMSGFARHAVGSATRGQKQILKKPFEIDLAISLLKEGLASDNHN
jgi:DNA-binding NtrC family response regulator